MLTNLLGNLIICRDYKAVKGQCGNMEHTRKNLSATHQIDRGIYKWDTYSNIPREYEGWGLMLAQTGLST
jgi:hypothetical protein